LTPVMRRSVAEFTQRLGESLQDATATVGKGDATRRQYLNTPVRRSGNVELGQLATAPATSY